MKTLIAAAFLSSFLASPSFAAESAPSLLAASVDAIKVHQWQRGARAAQAALETHLSPVETVAAYTDLCITLTNLSRYDAAIKACNESVERAPSRWTGYLNRGNLEAALGHLHIAADDFAIANSLNPGNTKVQFASSSLVFHSTPYSNSAFFAALLPQEEPGKQTAEAAK